jgi:SAM-dependent methyltransferase
VSERSSLQERAERLAQTRFVGGSPWTYERIGRLWFEVLIAEGLLPSSRVLDVGCGTLRLGYWLLHFLDPGHYYGIEPQVDMLEAGRTVIVEPDVLERADAHFAHNGDSDFSVFDARFDYVVACSIWTHASKAQITAMLASFAATSAPEGVFLASYHPASPWFLLERRWPPLRHVATMLPLDRMTPLLARAPALGRSREYRGETWVGRSHESDHPGVVKHSLRWIVAEAARHGLRARLMPYRVMHRQYWLRISRA